jgi:two-component system chemotaxis response regulator CheB
MTTGPVIRVLVVDDSALIRNLLKSALERHPRISVVGQAVDGMDALQKIGALRPDVVTLDVEMPRLNGIGVLERAAGKVPVAFLMVSTLTESGARVTLDALRRGAFDYITKPQGAGAANKGFQALVCQKVLSAAETKGKTRKILTRPGETSSAPTLPPNSVRGWIVGIGISCGGPQTLSEVLPIFPSDFVPIIVTQHMPAQFTKAFAAQLDGLCAMKVKEAAPGDVLQNGQVYIAPGSHHLKVRRLGTQITIDLDAGEKVSGHRPSADVMLGSLAKASGARSVGVIMTGMGSDGARGLVALHQAGGWTVAQDQATSLVYGMPKAAKETGAVDQIAPMLKIPTLVSQLLSRGPRAGVGAR